MGPHEANLRGELALEQLHFIKDVLRPDVQHDIDRDHVVELAEVEIVPGAKPLTPYGSRYGIKRGGLEPPVAISPGIEAFAGRYRAWVLPTSHVAVALEPLEDESSYLRRHRSELFALQTVDESHLVPLTELRRGRKEEFGMSALNVAYAVAGWLMNGRVRAYVEIPLERRRWLREYKSDPVNSFFDRHGAVYDHLVVGATYRIRPMKTWRHIVEAVAPEEETKGIGPYR